MTSGSGSSSDGTTGGRPNRCTALRFLRDWVEQAGPGGTVEVHPADNRIGTAYVFRGPGALFVGDSKFSDEMLSFTTSTPRNVMLRWSDDTIRIMAADDTTVRLRPGKLVPGLTPPATGLGQAQGDALVLDLLAGRTVKLPAR